MDSVTLTHYITNAPREPGVYTWRDAHRKPLYIGKAANLRNRLLHYPKTIDPRIRAMLCEAVTLSWETTETDIEALILESQLIKKWHPKYNIVMRDDKQYFYVGITDDEFPHVLLTHQPLQAKTHKKAVEFIGPFTDGAPLKSTLRILRGLFPYCTCKQKHYVPCLNAHIGRCLGYCCLRQQSSKQEVKSYQQNIRAIRDILTGKRDTLIRKMEKEMVAAGKRHELEIALALQKKIERIRRVFENAQINARRQTLAAQHHGALEQIESEFSLGRIPQRIEGYDIANIQGQHATGSMVVFTDGRADNQEYRKFTIKTVVGSNDTAMLTEVLSRRLAHPEWQYPDLILVDGGKGQLNAVRKVLVRLQLSIPVIALTKNDKHQGDHIFSSLDSRVRYLKDLLPPLVNLILHIDTEAHRFAIAHYRKRHQKTLR